MERYRIGKYFFNTFLADSFAKVHKVARVTGKPVLEMGLPGKVLHVGISYPGLGQGLVPQVVKPFEHQAAHRKTDGHTGLAGSGVQRPKLILKVPPVYSIGQQDQFMPRVNKI